MKLVSFESINQTGITRKYTLFNVSFYPFHANKLLQIGSKLSTRFLPSGAAWLSGSFHGTWRSNLSWKEKRPKAQFAASASWMPSPLWGLPDSGRKNCICPGCVLLVFCFQLRQQNHTVKNLTKFMALYIWWNEGCLGLMSTSCLQTCIVKVARCLSRLILHRSSSLAVSFEL